MNRRRVNITPAERMIRILIGTGLLIAALAVVSGGVTVISVVGALLLAGAGLDLLITGLIGFCPLYARLGYVPPSLRR